MLIAPVTTETFEPPRTWTPWFVPPATAACAGDGDIRSAHRRDVVADRHTKLKLAPPPDVPLMIRFEPVVETVPSCR
ncbi:MAG: hypothetical protein IPG58_02770 [Acidobacteria bacterium]|nr:hypothetical protein [Acidobacteriota bacterium]